MRLGLMELLIFFPIDFRFMKHDNWSRRTEFMMDEEVLRMGMKFFYKVSVRHQNRVSIEGYKL